MEYIFITILLIIKISQEEFSQFSLEEGQRIRECSKELVDTLSKTLSKHVRFPRNEYMVPPWLEGKEPNNVLMVQLLLLKTILNI